MNKARPFRTRLWLYFILFAAVIFSLLWILQTVFLQNFYNGMLAKNTCAAAEKIVAASADDDFTEVIDRLSAEDSLLVFVTEGDGTILYSSDAYRSYYNGPEHVGDGNSNPYHKGEVLSWQKTAYRNLPDGYDSFLEELQQSPQKKTEYTTDTQYVYGRVVSLSDGSEAVLYVSAALGAVGAAASIIRLQLFWVTLLSLVVAFGIAWFLARKFSVPVSQLSVQAKMLPTDRYEPVFEKGFCRELDELSDSLDKTAETLAAARNYQKELLANVSHDLRTPLTMIKGYAEMVRDISWEDDAQRIADTGIIIREADRLTALVNEILEYTRLQEGTRIIEGAEADLGKTVDRVCNQFEHLAMRNGQVIEREIADGCTIRGDEGLIERAAYNLIDNALRHTGDSGKIRVTVEKDGPVSSSLRFSVRDYGPGIPGSELPHIWEKYYTSRQRGGKGVSGLGLAIVRQIADLHGAAYGVENLPGEGCCFWICFSEK